MAMFVWAPGVEGEVALGEVHFVMFGVVLFCSWGVEAEADFWGVFVGELVLLLGWDFAASGVRRSVN